MSDIVCCAPDVLKVAAYIVTTNKLQDQFIKNKPAINNYTQSTNKDVIYSLYTWAASVIFD